MRNLYSTNTMAGPMYIRTVEFTKISNSELADYVGIRLRRKSVSGAHCERGSLTDSGSVASIQLDSSSSISIVPKRGW